jgi:hypothetical protein
MNITDDVKRLIGDGKTQQAIDMLQEIVENRDTDLLNQTLLLESQFKDLQRKMHLGLEDANAEINRIKNTLLILCDDVEKLKLEGNHNRKSDQTEKSPSSTFIFIIFGVVAALGIGLIVFLVLNDKPSKNETPNTDTPTRPTNTPKVETQKPIATNEGITWVTKPTFAHLDYRVYGDFLIDILDVNSQPIDGGNKTIKIKLKLTCTASKLGYCRTDYLRYRLGKTMTDSFEPKSKPQYKPDTPVKDGTFTNTELEFDVPKEVNEDILFIHYKNLLDVPLVKIRMKEQQ